MSSFVALLSFLFRIVIVAEMGWLEVESSKESSISNSPVILPLAVWMRAVEADRDCTHMHIRYQHEDSNTNKSNESDKHTSSWGKKYRSTRELPTHVNSNRDHVTFYLELLKLHVRSEVTDHVLK